MKLYTLIVAFAMLILQGTLNKFCMFYGIDGTIFLIPTFMIMDYIWCVYAFEYKRTIK